MSEPMEREEAYQLPEGTPVTITWSGGNGPHDYVIAVDRFGRRYAAMNTDPDDPLRWYNSLSFVGTERYHTQIVRRHLDEDPHGTTCPDCGQAIGDSRPYGPTVEGDLMHDDCGDPDEET